MRRRLVLIFIFLVVLAAGCSSSDDGGGTNADPSTPDTTIVGPPPTNTIPPDLLAQAKAMVGTWRGEWFNEDLDTTGDLVAEVTINPRETRIEFDLELGGEPFGNSVEDTQSMSFPIAHGSTRGLSPIFGVYEVNILADGSFTMTGTPGRNRTTGTFDVVGVLTEDTIIATYDLYLAASRSDTSGTISLRLEDLTEETDDDPEEDLGSGTSTLSP